MTTMKTTGPRKMRCPRCNAVGENEVLTSMRNETVWCPWCAKNGERSACVLVVAPKERPILFSAPMVRALLEGRKTQTRRVIAVQPPADGFTLGRVMSTTQRPRRRFVDRLHWIQLDGSGVRASDERYFDCPYGVVGDRLWVKETHTFVGWDENGGVDIEYPADGGRASRIARVDDFDIWVEKRERQMRRSGADVVGDMLQMPDGVRTPSTPSIFMQRWASRITLEVTDVRVERLQSISAADAVAEGVRRFDDIPDDATYPPGPRWSAFEPKTTRDCLGSAYWAFGNLWCHVNGDDSWRANPWVWVVEFAIAEVRR